MKKFIFPIFIVLFSGVAFGEGCLNIINTNLPADQQVGENQRFITADIYSDTAPRYLKCGANDNADNKFCSIGTITFDSNYNVYTCKDNKWVKTKVEDCTMEARELLNTTGLKYNYQQAKATNSRYVLFYNKQSPGQHLVTYCLSPIEPFKRMEDECNKNGDLDSGICHKLTTISNNTTTSPTKASDNIGLQNSEQTIPTDSLQETGDYETHKEFDSAAWRRDTENAYKHERDNAQSWANKGITAGSTLLTGEGAMKAAQAIAEQKADKKAEEQMAEWISKMGCEYGNGQQVNLGKEETLPGGNELTQYYTEYKQLADKLKATKTALNLRPGIESEVLYDRAETGLYQYANTERQSGGFTSLSRALMDPTGTDAEQWNAQKAEVAKDLTTGTLLTAGGLVVGAAGNYLVNRNHKKEYQELEKKTKLQQSLDEAVEEILPTVELSPVQIGDESSTVLDTSALTKPELTLNTNISIPKYPITGESFATDSDVITDTKQLNSYIARINSIMEYNHMPYMQTIHFNIVGHTDRTGSATYNNQLSERRAESVKNYLEKNLNVPSEYFTVTYDTEGKGFTECPQKGKKNKPECRRVDITVEDKTERANQN
jgi:outer membrane protein OmpA-like peptidoglycan-associated protein